MAIASESRIRTHTATAQTILIVDDSPESLTFLNELLQPHYQVRAAVSGQQALHIARLPPYPDLILLDVMMPCMDGHEVFRQLRADPATSDISVIFVTAMDSVEAEKLGLEVGAEDYITKPILPTIMLARVRTQMELKLARDRLRDQNSCLEAEVAKRMAENQLTQEISIRALAHLAEIRDPETGNHILRTQGYVNQLAKRLQTNPHFTSVLNDSYIQVLTQSAPLHDIGKVGIPDSILLKPGSLNAQEWEVMKTHASLGSEAIDLAGQDGTESLMFLSIAKEIARWHHEKWDGTGYPDGIAGAAIPISARIMALADVFDALISPRVYKNPMSYEEAKQIILAGRGKHFDPDIVDAFLFVFDNFCEIAERYREHGLGMPIIKRVISSVELNR
ncbi:MAG: HD domain-containing phosphohydrolase [Georgfuchsia sp.]